MSDDLERTPVSSVRISSSHDRIDVVAEERVDVAVKGEAVVTYEGGCATISAVDSALTVRVPERISIVVGSQAAPVVIAGPAGDVAVVTASGRIKIDEATSVDARTNSARVTVGRSGGQCRIRSESGRIEVGACESADVATVSGRITMSGVDGPVRAHCVSGRIDIEMEGPHDVEAETVSGRVRVSLPAGVEAWRSTGTADMSTAPEGCDCVVNVRSVSGRVEVSSR